MKIDWTKTAHCQSGTRCKECRRGDFAGTNTESRYAIPQICPYGIYIDTRGILREKNGKYRPSKPKQSLSDTVRQGVEKRRNCPTCKNRGV